MGRVHVLAARRVVVELVPQLDFRFRDLAKGPREHQATMLRIVLLEREADEEQRGTPAFGTRLVLQQKAVEMCRCSRPVATCGLELAELQQRFVGAR